MPPPHLHCTSLPGGRAGAGGLSVQRGGGSDGRVHGAGDPQHGQYRPHVARQAAQAAETAQGQFLFPSMHRSSRCLPTSSESEDSFVVQQHTTQVKVLLLRGVCVMFNKTKNMSELDECVLNHFVCLSAGGE